MRAVAYRCFGWDVVRATAVLAVIFHHVVNFTTTPAWLSFYGPLGAMGAEMLLVLSGYLIGQSLLKKTAENRFGEFRHVSHFYVRRWTRTLPGYYFYLLITAALFPIFVDQLRQHGSYFFFLQNFAWNMPPFFFQSWTLTILEFFYFVFPLALLGASYFTPSRLIRFLVPISLLVIAAFSLRMLHVKIEDEAGFGEVFRTRLIYQMDIPIAGVVVALIEAEFPRLWSRLQNLRILALAAFGGCVFLHLFGCPGLYTYHWLQVVFYPCIAGLLAITFPVLSTWKTAPLFLGSSIMAVSQVSYSLYLSHYFALWLATVLLSQFSSGMEQGLQAYPFFIVAIGLVGYLSYRLVEEPFIRLREAKVPPRSLIHTAWGWLYGSNRLTANQSTRPI